jgi:predicted RNA-binding protein with EMAP domain
MEGFEDEDWSQEFLEDMESEMEFFLSLQGVI